MSKVFFLHISDLHLRPALPGGLEGREADIRTELLGQVVKWKAKHSESGRVIGVLVTGDVTAGGKAEEFETARNWFATLTEVAGCDISKVYVVPGNHDVDRSVHEGNNDLAELHADLRKVPHAKLEERLRALLLDKAASDLLLLPLANYSDFARSYRCGIDAESLAWSQVVELGEGISIRVVGLTTCLISDKEDVRGESGLVLGGWQAIIPSDDKSLTIAMMHHPPSWLREGPHVERPLGNRAQLVLSGHEHSFDAKRVEPYAGSHFLRVEAGALHPNESEVGWQPCFNWIEIEYPSSHGARTALLRVHPFRWDVSSSSFQPHVGLTQTSLDLQVQVYAEPVIQPSLVDVPDEAVNVDPIHLPTDVMHNDAPPNVDLIGGTMPTANGPDARAVYFRYRELPTASRVRLLRGLGLTVDKETRAATEQGIKATLSEVKARGLAAKFVNAVWQEFNDSL